MSDGTATRGRPPAADLPPSLANAPVGARIRVERILLDAVRAACRERRIRVGGRIRVMRRERGLVLVRTANGRTARLPTPYAYFVKVSHAEVPGDTPAAKP